MNCCTLFPYTLMNGSQRLYHYYLGSNDTWADSGFRKFVSFLAEGRWFSPGTQDLFTIQQLTTSMEVKEYDSGIKKNINPLHSKMFHLYKSNTIVRIRG